MFKHLFTNLFKTLVFKYSDPQITHDPIKKDLLLQISGGDWNGNKPEIKALKKRVQQMILNKRTFSCEIEAKNKVETMIKEYVKENPFTVFYGMEKQKMIFLDVYEEEPKFDFDEVEERVDIPFVAREENDVPDFEEFKKLLPDLKVCDGAISYVILKGSSQKVREASEMIKRVK